MPLLHDEGRLPMARVPPVSREEVPELEDAFDPVEQRMEFLPNSMLTMAHHPLGWR
jgi:hypothetical protein